MGKQSCQFGLAWTLREVVGVLACLLLCSTLSMADVVADSSEDWAGDDSQGYLGWHYGYYNYTLDTDETYEADDFEEFESDYWSGTQWDLELASQGPWTEIGQENGHPNGENSFPNEEHWAIRRWVAESITQPTAMTLTWHLRKTNTGGGGGTGAFLFLNGQELDSTVIEFDDDIGVTQSVQQTVRPGDIIDLALTPENADGTRGDSYDGSIFTLIIESEGVVPSALQAGDANMDYKFDQLDLVQVQIAARYLTGQAATWGEGDWNGAPGGSQGSPPQGDGVFNQLDIIAALNAGKYLTGPYAALPGPGTKDDGQTSLVYHAGTGELSVDPAAGKNLTSVNIDSAGSRFIGSKPAELTGSFDNFGPGNIFKATFGGQFGAISFGSVLAAGLSEDVVRADLTVVGSLAGGGDLGAVDLVYIPEPASLLLLAVGSIAVIFSARRRSTAK